MNCDRARVLMGVHDELDAPTRRALREHTVSCRDCADSWLAEQEFRALVGTRRSPPASAEQMARLLAIPGTDLRWIRVRAALLRMAPVTMAVALLAGGAWLVSRGQPAAGPDTHDVAQVAHVGAPPTALARGGPLRLYAPATATRVSPSVTPPQAPLVEAPAEKLVFVVASPPPAEARPVLPAPASSLAGSTAAGRSDEGERGVMPPTATGMPPPTVPAPQATAPAVPPPWDLTITVLPGDAAARPSGELLIHVDAVTAPMGAWEPLAEIVAGFDGAGVITARHVQNTMAPPFIVTLFGVESLSELVVCDGASASMRVGPEAFGAARSATVAFRLCRPAAPPEPPLDLPGPAPARPPVLPAITPSP